MDELALLDEDLRHLHREANSKAVFLVNARGRSLASAGETEQFDTTGLASLIAANAALIRDGEFVQEGQQENVHLSIVGNRAILAVIFDQRSTLGLVRLRVKRSAPELSRVLESIAAKDGGLLPPLLHA